MADGDPKPKFRTTPVSGTTRGTTTQATLDKLRSIYIYTDELKKRAEGERARGEGGTVTFVTTSNNKLLATLGKTYFPAGTFEAKIDRRLPKQRPTISSLTAIFPKDLDAEVMKGLQAVLNSPTNVMTWGSKDGAVLKKIERAFDSSSGATIRIVVSYSKATTGNPTTLPNTVPLTDAQSDVLKDPAIARLYLQFVEHFGGLPVDYSLAEDGIDRAELDQIEKGRQPFIDITNLFTQCVGEFLAVKRGAPPPPVGIPELSAMTEQIFNQRKNKNDLARRNLLGIALGHLIFVDEQGAIRSKRDIGVIRKTGGDNAEIIYDRNGAPVRVLGYSDTEFRSVDMKKVSRDTGLPTFDITISDPALYAFLRSLEQTLGQPLREMEALAVSLYKHSIFIAESIARNYNGELSKRVIEMLPIVIGFFVAHAIASFLVSRGHPAGIAFMALIKGTGLVLGIDGQLMSFKQMAIAGSHFALMEELHRETSTGKKIELTKLSQAHLDAGARILMDAIVDFIASGVILVGVFLPSRVGPAILKGIKNRAAARSKVTVKDSVATEIEPTTADETVKVPIEKKLEGGESGLETTEGRAAKDKPPEAHNVEQPNAHVAEGQKGSTPALKAFTRKRPRALDQTPDEFASDKAAQQELFEAAGLAVTRQKAFIAEVVKDLGIKDVEVVSVRKRENLADFVHGIIAKIKGRKSYKTVSEMSDIIRGRISVKNPKDVKRIMQEIVARGMLSPGGFKRPSTRSGVKDGYPRWHVDVIEPESGIVHEWQIGTKASNRLYQDTGIDVGVVKIARENRNLHDVEYDIFKAIEEPPVVGRTPEQIAELKALAAEVGIPDFRVRLAKLSARTGNEAIPDSELALLIKSFHDEAGKILKALVDKKGAAFVESFLH